MTDNADGCKRLCMDELGQIKYVGRHWVVAIARPSAIAVSAQIGRDDMPILAQCLRRPIPAAAVITATVQQTVTFPVSVFGVGGNVKSTRSAGATFGTNHSVKIPPPS